jgi:protein unc-45
MDSGVSQALSLMSKHNSENCKEQIASVYLVLCENPDNRGKLVAAGGGKALIPLALGGTEVGKTRACQALAKIAISINPELAFPGQRCLEVVRPLIKLLHPDKTALENFESLMALTNLAGVNDSVRKRIVKEQGVSNIEHYMFDEHVDLRRAGTECMCNLVQDEDVVFLYEKPDNDRIKLLVLYCGEEDDLKLNLAASGALAQLTRVSEKICERTLETVSFVKLFKTCACSEDVEFQFRIFYIINNIMSQSKEFCAKIVESELMDVIVAMSRLDVEKERTKVWKKKIWL